MADRIVKVSLVAQVNNYVANMEAASKSTKKVGDSLEAQKAASIAAAKAQGEASKQVGAGFLAIGAVAAVGIGMAVAKFAEFDKTMSAVQAATGETAEGMGVLRQAALDAGADTSFSAAGAAEAITELGKAGLSTADILGGGLAGALDLAAAGQLDVARAAEISAITLSQFKLAGSDASRVADTLAAGANKALGSVDDLANGLKFVGPIASSMGISLEETTGTLALFAQQGIIGEQAGTSLRGVLSSLTSPAGAASKEIERLGITLYDSEGNFLGLENAAGELSSAYSTMDEEARNASMGVIFGRETITAATALYQAGAGGVAEWTGAVTESGFAAEQAALLLDNLAGDFEELSGSIETAFIGAGSGANDVLRLLTQSATDSVNAFNNLPTGAQQASLGLASVVTGGTLAAGAFFTLVPKVAEFNRTLADLGPGAQKAGKFVGALGKGLGLLAGLGAAAVVLDNLANGGYAAAQGIEQTTLALGKMDLDGVFSGFSGDVTDYASSLDLLFGNGINSNMERFGSTLNGIFAGGQLSDQVADTREQFGTMGQSLADLVNSGDAAGAAELFDGLAVAADKQGVSTKELMELFPQYAEALAGVKNEQNAATTSTDSAAVAYQEAADKAAELEGNLSTLIDTINRANGVGQDAVSSNATFEASMAGIADEVQRQKDAYEEANGTLNGFTLSLDESTLSGSANAAMLSGVAADAQAAALAQFEVDKTTMSAKDATDKYISTLGQSREELRLQAEANGYSADEVQKLIDKVFALPTQREVQIIADTAEASAAVNRFITNNTGRRVELIVDGVAGRRVVGSDVTAKATGGAITGPGTGTSDTAGLFRLSNGEHVLTAAEVAAMGGQSAVYDFRRGLRGQSYVSAPAVSFAGGGGSGSRGGDTFNISTPADPVATAQAVQRRQSALGSV